MTDPEEFYRRHSKSFDKLHAVEREDELVEKMARVLYLAFAEINIGDGEDRWERLLPRFRAEYREQARAALAAARPVIRNEALEEAAQVCDRRYMGDNNREDMEARRCAAAIRAMKDEP